MESKSTWSRPVAFGFLAAKKRNLANGEISVAIRRAGYSAIGFGLLAGGLSALPTIAIANDGWVVGGSVGQGSLKSENWQVDFENDTATRPDGPLARVNWVKGIAGGLHGGYAFSSGLRIELEAQYRSNEVSSIDIAPVGLNAGGPTVRENGDQKAEILFANVWYDLFNTRTWHPYVGGGAGYAKVSIKDFSYDGDRLHNDDDAAFIYQLGAGVGFEISENVTFSVDYRYAKSSNLHYDLLDPGQPSTIKTKYEADTILLGVRYSFGGHTKEETAQKGEEPVQVVEPIETAAEMSTPVAESESPAEAASTQCDAPNPGDLIGADGCKAGNTTVLRGVTFEHNQSVLTAESKTILDGVSDQLKSAGNARISIVGHTDSLGNDELNRALSESRADSVKLYLIEHGVDGSHMTAIGMGSAQPIADNDTEEGRQQNRRVELKIVDSASTAAAPIETAPAQTSSDYATSTAEQSAASF